MFPDTSTYFAIITFVPAGFIQCFMHIQKRVISFESLVVRGCGFDCVILKCTSDCFFDKKRIVSLIDKNHKHISDDKEEEQTNSRKYFYENKTFKVNLTRKRIELK